MHTWKNYLDTIGDREHSVVGTLKLMERVHSPQLGNRRDLYVYLPPSYAQSERRYPVIYMHDGQNLFDRFTSYAGEWHVDETMERLAGEGREAIIVGVPNTGADRLDEYSPFHDERINLGGRGDRYLAFLAETVKPLIDTSFRTLPGREHTGTMGSSMGGLISLYAFFHLAEVIGFAGVVSPSLWFAEGAIYHYVRTRPCLPGRIYIDVGTRESVGVFHDRLSARTFARHYVFNVHRMYDMLRDKGYRPGEELCYVEEIGGEHNEPTWSRRLPRALRFLLPL